MLRDPQCTKITVDGEGSQGSAMMSLPQKGAAGTKFGLSGVPSEAKTVPHVTLLSWKLWQTLLGSSLVGPLWPVLSLRA